MVQIEQQILDADICKMVQNGTAKMVAGFQDFMTRTDILEQKNWEGYNRIPYLTNV